MGDGVGRNRSSDASVSVASDAYPDLVTALYAAIVPNAVMTASMAVIGGYVAAKTGDPIMRCLLVAAVVAGLAKLLLLAAFRRRAPKALDGAGASGWERPFAVLSIGFALALGLFVARVFWASDPTLGMLGTGLLFGYCSGVVARASVRPRIAYGSVVSAALPVIFACVARDDGPHALLAALFAIFVIGSFESIRFAYRMTRHHIAEHRAMADLARYDPLTGLLNRHGLNEAFVKLEGRVAIHALDLDGFKAINDRLGHSAGDEMLRIVAGRLAAGVREHDLTARLGGDEFAVVQTGFADDADAAAMAARLLQALRFPCSVGGEMLPVGVSLGYVCAAATIGLDRLVARADDALYASKRGSGDAVRGEAVAQPTGGDRRRGSRGSSIVKGDVASR